MIGRRRPDTPHDSLPDDIQPGDYWKVIDKSNGMPARSDAPSNLTGEVWYVAAPTGRNLNADKPDLSERWYLLANLTQHTVREHEDGTISVRPGDGSSNSILVTRRPEERWHGYIEHGEWRAT